MKTFTAKANTAQTLWEKARREAHLGHNSKAAENYLRAGKLWAETGDFGAAEKAWRRACDFCERTANQIFQNARRGHLQ